MSYELVLRSRSFFHAHFTMLNQTMSFWLFHLLLLFYFYSKTWQSDFCSLNREKSIWKMKLFKHHVVLVTGPSNHAYDVSEKAGLMYLNRFSIDEEAAFEATGVYSMQKYGTTIPYSLQFRFFRNQMKLFAETKPKDSKP